jgi:hypothetical protein
MNIRNFLPFAAVAAITFTAFGADEAPSLLPPFGAAGAEFARDAKDGNKTKGWLPKDWVDNSEWAAVSATYTKLNDPPAGVPAAVRIKVEKVDEGQLQLTSWTKPAFKKNVKYVIAGWIRSADNSAIKIGVRQPGEPYEFYAEEDLSGSAEWKPFTFDFTLTEDREAFVMFIKQDTGVVDLAGLTVRAAGK